LQRVQLLKEELTIVADAAGATVIFLHSHPAWVAAQQRARERSESMRRHPSFLARRRAAASGAGVVPVTRNFKVYSGTDTSA
jgi:Ni/Fe-hydrogenase subunit HybB-like protein